MLMTFFCFLDLVYFLKRKEKDLLYIDVLFHRVFELFSTNETFNN